MLNLPVLLGQENGHYTAKLLTDPTCKGEGPTRDRAIASLRGILNEMISRGELIGLPVKDSDLTIIPVHPKGLHPIIGRYKDDPTLADLREEVYRLRDAQREAEHGS